MAASVRLARLLDAGDIARLTMQLGYESETSVVTARLSRILLRPDHQFFVAECDGGLVGWLHAVVSEYVESEAFVVIGGLVVDKSHRRKGIGSLLMRHAEEWARTSGCSIIRLSSSVGRTGAHEFYQELGYTNLKTQYSFMKSLDVDGRKNVNKFVPRLDE